MRDFEACHEVGADLLTSRSLAFRVTVQGARLLAPVL